VGESVSLVDGDSVGNTVSRVENDTGGASRGVEGQDGLDGDVEGGGIERLEHDLRHLLSVDLGVEGSLGEEDGVLLGCDSELVVELREGGRRGSENKRTDGASPHSRCGARSSPCRPSW
jgi:hypothetical protein